MTRIISFVGTSDSGKTTILTRIIPKLVERGIKVAEIGRAHG